MNARSKACVFELARARGASLLWRQVLAQQGRARASRMTLPHNVCYTPMFMPVGTQGAHLSPTWRLTAGCTCSFHLDGSSAHVLPRPGIRQNRDPPAEGTSANQSQDHPAHASARDQRGSNHDCINDATSLNL